MMINIRAPLVILSSDEIVENGFITVCNGIVMDAGKGRGDAGANLEIELADRVLMPGVINAHTHLELTALWSMTRTGCGMIPWIESIIAARSAKASNSSQSVASGLFELKSKGTALVGEISSYGDPTAFLSFKDIAGIWFFESIKDECKSLPRDVSFTSLREKKISFAAHAPHTTYPETITSTKEKCRRHGGLFSIHVAESPEEIEFIDSGTGSFALFLNKRGMDPKRFIHAKSPVRLLDKLGVLDSHTLAVHLNWAVKSDIEILAARHVRICICPRSNYAITQRLPDIQTMLSTGIRPALGTDSLASVSSLDIWDEITFITDSYKTISPEIVFNMATKWGAEALGFSERYGQIRPGASSRIISIRMESPQKKNIIERITTGDFDRSDLEWIPDIIRKHQVGSRQPH